MEVEYRYTNRATFTMEILRTIKDMAKDPWCGCSIIINITTTRGIGCKDNLMAMVSIPQKQDNTGDSSKQESAMVKAYK